MNKQRIAILVAAAAGMLGTFLPWVTVPFIGSINGTEGDGYITLALYAVTLGLMLAGNRTLPVSGGMMWGALAPALIASAIGIWKLVDFNSAVSDNPFASAISIGVGLYIVALAGIIATVLAFVIKDKPTASY